PIDDLHVDARRLARSLMCSRLPDEDEHSIRADRAVRLIRHGLTIDVNDARGNLNKPRLRSNELARGDANRRAAARVELRAAGDASRFWAPSIPRVADRPRRELFGDRHRTGGILRRCHPLHRCTSSGRTEQVMRTHYGRDVLAGQTGAAL